MGWRITKREKCMMMPKVENYENVIILFFLNFKVAIMSDNRANNIHVKKQEISEENKGKKEEEK